MKKEILSWTYAAMPRPPATSANAELLVDKIMALFTSQLKKAELEGRIEQMELLRWLYKEKNDQSVSVEFLNAYNQLMDELQAQKASLKDKE